MRYFIVILLLIHSLVAFGAKTTTTDKNAEAIFGTNLQKLTYHEPMYVIGGDDDLKLQFSFKYRLSQELNLYFAYTQIMFWDIFEESKPFSDVNYRPELFYRFFEKRNQFFTNLDIGYLHFSNGNKEENSRSVDRVFLRSSIVSKLNRHTIGGTLGIHHLYGEDKTNKDIKKYLGYWEARFFVADFILINDDSINLNFRVNAGEKVYDLDKGSYDVGLSYNFGGVPFNPSLYIQRFEGYAESLLKYNRKRVEHRIGFMMSY